MAKDEKVEKVTLSGEAVGADSAALRRRCEQLAGELDAALIVNQQLKERSAGLEAEVRELKARLNNEHVSTLPELPEAAFELIRSVTLPVVGGGTASARAGDVVALKDSERLQRRLGDKARVYQIDDATLDELGKGSFLRAR